MLVTSFGYCHALSSTRLRHQPHGTIPMASHVGKLQVRKRASLEYSTMASHVLWVRHRHGSPMASRNFSRLRASIRSGPRHVHVVPENAQADPARPCWPARCAIVVYGIRQHCCASAPNQRLVSRRVLPMLPSRASLALSASANHIRPGFKHCGSTVRTTRLSPSKYDGQPPSLSRRR
jgi:hypothetical protein